MLEPLAPLGELPRPGAAKENRRQVSQLGAAVIGGIAGGLAGLLLVTRIPAFFEELDRLGRGPAVVIPTLLGGGVAAIALHEWGHIAGGRLAGWRPLLWNVGPVRLAHDGRRWRLALHTAWALWGGVAFAAPERYDGADRLRRENLLMVAGGPAMSVVGFVLGMLGWYLLRGVDQALPGWLALAGLCVGFNSGLIALATIIPMRMGPIFMSDGMQILQLRRAAVTDTPDFALRTLRLLGTLVRPREWPIEALARAEAVSAPTERAAAAWLAAMAALDRGDEVEAHQAAHRCLQAVVSETRPAQLKFFVPEYEGGAAAIEAVVRRDPATARALLDSAEARGEVTPITRGLARAAIALAEGDPAAARRLAAEALTAHAASAVPLMTAAHAPLLELVRGDRPLPPELRATA